MGYCFFVLRTVNIKERISFITTRVIWFKHLRKLFIHHGVVGGIKIYTFIISIIGPPFSNCIISNGQDISLLLKYESQNPDQSSIAYIRFVFLDFITTCSTGTNGFTFLSPSYILRNG